MSIRVRDYLLAVEDAQLARLAAPRDPRGCSLEGAAQLGLGEVVRARECFLAGLQLDPRSQFMQSGLKATRQMLGDVSPELAEDPELEQVEEGDEDQEGANEVAAARQLDEPCGDDTLDMAEITSPEGDKREQAEKTYEPQEEEGGFDDDTESLREYDAEITREASQAESLPTDKETEHVEVEKLSVADSADESSHRVAEKFASDAPATREHPEHAAEPVSVPSEQAPYDPGTPVNVEAAPPTSPPPRLPIWSGLSKAQASFETRPGTSRPVAGSCVADCD